MSGEEVVGKYKQALSTGMDALRRFQFAGEDGKELNDSIEDDFNEQPLPYVIGTREFLEEEDLGLGIVRGATRLWRAPTRSGAAPTLPPSPAVPQRTSSRTEARRGRPGATGCVHAAASVSRRPQPLTPPAPRATLTTRRRRRTARRARRPGRRWRGRRVQQQHQASPPPRSARPRRR